MEIYCVLRYSCFHYFTYIFVENIFKKIFNLKFLFQSYCCRGEINNFKVGGCTLHAQKCNGGLGIFIKPNRCELVILMDKTRGTVLNYVHGENSLKLVVSGNFS